MLSLDKWRSTAQWGHGAASLHVGPAYAADTQVARLDGGPLGTELVLELDELPAGVDEAARWAWMRHATEVSLHVLREWFGVRAIFGFASGNRGPHLWLLDDAVLQQTKAERGAFFERLSHPCEHEGWRELAEQHLLPFYRSLMSDGGAAAPPSDAELARLAYPTFDRAVATDPSHLHRLPFSVNEKTGRVAVPFALAPAFEGLPRAPEDMPRVDDPELQSKLETPLGVLKAALRSLGGDNGAAIADVPPNSDAPWNRRSARKRKERLSDATTADLPVAPLRVDAAATVAWLEALRGAANDAATVSGIDNARVRSVAARSQGEGKDWRARLRREADAIAKLVAALKLQQDAPAGECMLLIGETYTNGDGRTLTHYPQLDEAQYVMRLAKASRHAITADAYAEVDLAAAHLAGAWGACERHLGAAEAARRCPNLQLAATNKKAARALVASQSQSWTTERAKRAIVAALNQEPGDGVQRCAFLEALVAERPHMAEALRAHPAIAGAPLESIRRRCKGHAKPAVRELSLMLHTLEAAIVRRAVGTLGEHGFETGAFLADGLLVRSRQGVRDKAALDRALEAVTAAVGEALGVRVIMECEK